MASLTRKEYDRMVCEGRALPSSFVLIERDGTRRDVFLTAGAAAPVENPRMLDTTVRVAVAKLADLVEFYHVGETDRPVDSPFSDFLECGDGFKMQYADVLEAHVAKALLHVENWLQTRPQKDWECADLVPMAKEYVRVLRAAGF
jgi:hypothetical protein